MRSDEPMACYGHLHLEPQYTFKFLSALSVPASLCLPRALLCSVVPWMVRGQHVWGTWWPHSLLNFHGPSILSLSSKKKGFSSPIFWGSKCDGRRFRHLVLDADDWWVSLALESRALDIFLSPFLLLLPSYLLWLGARAMPSINLTKPSSSDLLVLL